MRFEFSATVACPPDEVFAFLRDIEQYAGREGSVVPVYDKITAGPTGIGTRYREIVRLLPLVNGEIITEITSYQPGRRLEYTFSGLGMDGELSYRFEPAGRTTRVSQTQILRPRGALKLLSPLIGPMFSRMAGRRLVHIKRLLEEENKRDMNAIGLRIVRHTRNFDRMLRFYRDTLGMTYVRGWDRPGNQGALLSPGESVGTIEIEVLALADLAMPDAQPANVELSIEVEDVNAWYDRLEAAGVTIARGLEDTPWGHRSFGIDDPDGMRIWVYEVL